MASSENFKIGEIKAFLLDLDGTVYLEDRLIEGSLLFLQKAREKDKKVYFLTNNSSKTARDYQEKLNRMGIDAGNEQIITSTQAAARMLHAEAPGKKIFVLGNDAMVGELRNLGIDASKDDGEAALVGFDTSMTYDSLAKACDMVRQGCSFYATHPDINCPTREGYVPDCGSILAAIEASTGKSPQGIAGKPYRAMVETACGRTGLGTSDMAMVGDRLYTDIRMANDYGLKGILVLSGESKREDVRPSKVWPDLIVESLRELADLL